jgi:hypothetical protein
MWFWSHYQEFPIFLLKSSAYAIYTPVMAHFNCTAIQITYFITFASSIAVSLVKEYAFGKSPLAKEHLNCMTAQLDKSFATNAIQLY